MAQNLISGARRCTKVHGGVFRSPGSPPLGQPAWPARPCKTENRSSFQPPGRLSRLAHSRRAPKTSDKTRQNIPKRAKPCFGNSESLRSAPALLYKTVRFWTGFGPVFVQNLDTERWRSCRVTHPRFHFRSSEVISGHLWSSRPPRTPNLESKSGKEMVKFRSSFRADGWRGLVRCIVAVTGPARLALAGPSARVSHEARAVFGGDFPLSASWSRAEPLSARPCNKR
jgi:hypothetical protein